MTTVHVPNLAPRSVWKITGADQYSFLQGLLSNDVLPLQKAPGVVWAALLTPQGKYLADLFVTRRDLTDDAIYIDIDARLAATTLRRLTMYKLRADVAITPIEWHVHQGFNERPADAFADPRHEDLGWRRLDALPQTQDLIPAEAWRARRIALLVPEYPDDLRPDDSYLLESRFEPLNGVNFRKGCYVGQEVTARMKHKTELRKGLVRLSIAGEAESGTPILLEDGREAGILGSVANDQALAFMRFDRMDQKLTAGQAQLSAQSIPTAEA